MSDSYASTGIIYVQSFRTAITMAAAGHGLEVYEYAPKRVKQAVVGRGAADKQQVAFMMRALLHLTETPDPDPDAALAIGMAHLYANQPGRAQVGEAAKPI